MTSGLALVGLAATLLEALATGYNLRMSQHASTTTGREVSRETPAS